MTDISFDVDGFAYDKERKVIPIYGIYRGVINMRETPQPFQTDYVHILRFTDGKISHVTKVWQDDFDLRQATSIADRLRYSNYLKSSKAISNLQCH